MGEEINKTEEPNESPEVPKETGESEETLEEKDSETKVDENPEE